MKRIFNWTFGSFFRTLGRFLFYILIGTLVSILFSNVHAASFGNLTLTDDTSGTGGAWSANSSGYYFNTNGYRTIEFQTGNIGDILNISDYQYGFISYCSYDNVYQTYRQNSMYSSELQMFDTYVKSAIYGSSIPCTIKYITFKINYDCGATGTNCISSPRIKFYGDISDYSLRSFGFTKEPLQVDMSTGQILNQNATIIDQNTQIINKTDEINNITSDDSDTTSSKCGIICKLKGIFTGIIELPGKILNLLKSLFIPDDFDFVNEFADTLEDKLGFIAQVPISFITFLKDLATATWEDITSITFPEIEVFGYKFWTSQEIDITLILNKLKPYRYVTDIACVCICIAALKRHYDNFGGKS